MEAEADVFLRIACAAEGCTRKVAYMFHMNSTWLYYCSHHVEESDAWRWWREREETGR